MLRHTSPPAFTMVYFRHHIWRLGGATEAQRLVSVLICGLGGTSLRSIYGVSIKLKTRCRFSRKKVDLTDVKCQKSIGPWPRRGSSHLSPRPHHLCGGDRGGQTPSKNLVLGQYANSPGRRASCYAELAVFFLSGSRKFP